MFRHLILGSIIWIVLLLVGCTSAAIPQQIAAQPKEAPIPIAPSHVSIVYRAYIELQVSNIDRAAERATQLAYENGGYLVSSQSWYVDGRKNTTVELAVPTSNFENLRRSLLSLGRLVSENVSGDLVETGYFNQTPYSQITLQFRTSTLHPPPINIDNTGWNPAQTFQRALSVFISIFGFLMDILIWVVVVAGPFVLIALGVTAIIKRMRQSS